MPWLQLHINTSRDHATNIENALQDCGALSVTLEDNADQPIFEPELGETPLWNETRVTGLFDASVNTQALSQRLENTLGETLSSYQWQILEDKDWEREWMSHYHPIQCGENFWICPSWTNPPEPEATNLMLDPGLAFGTGTHPTTFLCLEWIAQQPFEGKDVIDYGCGSGILGIAALLLNAEKVVGVDIDPQALIATQDNAARNNLDKERFPVFFPAKCPNEPQDYVLANILAGPLVELAPTLISLLKPNAKLCLSGILKSQEKAIVGAYENDIEIEKIAEKDGWICLTGHRKTQ